MGNLREINQLARVEGHGRIRLEQQAGRVVNARLELYESLRLFEALVVGRRYDEIAEIVCRICSICSTVHKVTALRAVERALGLTVSPQTGLLRQLAVQGGQIESHALHLYCLALPDYFGCGGFPELAQRAPAELQRGLAIKALGNRIQELVGGRAIHPFNLLLGGLGCIPAADSLKLLVEHLQELLPTALAAIELTAGLQETLPGLPPLACCAACEGPSLFGELLATSDGQRQEARDAYAWLDERLQDDSHAKVSAFCEHGPYLVGPLARLNLEPPLESSAHAALRSHAPQLLGAPLTASHLARSIELLQAIERSLALCSQLLEQGMQPEQPATTQPHAGSATALIEAPRGLLLHQYTFDTDGRCTAAQVVTPTAINQRAMAAMLAALVERLPDSAPDAFTLQAERLIRCFDPCISCAVH